MSNGSEELEKQIEKFDDISHDAVKEIFIYEREISQTLLVVISAIFAFLVTQPEKNLCIYGSIISLSFVLFLSIGMLIYRRNTLKIYQQISSMMAQEGDLVLQGKNSSLKIPNNLTDIKKQAGKVDFVLMISYIFFLLGIILFVIGFSV